MPANNIYPATENVLRTVLLNYEQGHWSVTYSYSFTLISLIIGRLSMFWLSIIFLLSLRNWVHWSRITCKISYTRTSSMYHSVALRAEYMSLNEKHWFVRYAELFYVPKMPITSTIIVAVAQQLLVYWLVNRIPATYWRCWLGLGSNPGPLGSNFSGSASDVSGNA